MGIAERRAKIISILCRRRSETISNLAFELGVSARTILRDIEVLSLTEPIYTQCGRHGGGVYVMENYFPNKMYMTDNEISVLNKLYMLASRETVCRLDDEEKKILEKIILQYKQPTNRKE